MRIAATIAGAAGLALAAGGTFIAMPKSAAADRPGALAPLIDDAGHAVGEARFVTGKDGLVTGHVRLTFPADALDFHGLHIHANPAGTGCVAGTGFTGVGGHWDDGGQKHGSHHGDLPSINRRADGTGEITFVTDRFTVPALLGKAVVVHAGPDNFANIPLGADANTYADNGTAFWGNGGSAQTGNAGPRYACGVVAATKDVRIP
jgi:Cu-Zn family superoxide dismutase